ncbi:glycosyltransferase family 2 protein, partial [Candidatus Woesearchaeota archaeon]
MSDVWVVIAAFNEEKNIGGVIDKTKEFCKNIVVVDDGSSDNTFEIAKSKGVFVLRHVVNLGKGAAVKTGCDFAVSRGAGVLVLIDGDGQHDPGDISRFLDALNGKDVVFGFRRLSGSMPFVFRFGNWVINLFTRFLYGVCLRDTQCGFRVLTADAYKKVRWRA